MPDKSIGLEQPQNLEIRQKVVDRLESIELSNEWSRIDNLPDLFTGSEWQAGGWGRIINGKKVFIILSHENAHHTEWRLFVNGVFVKNLDNIVQQMGSAQNAMRLVDHELSTN